MYDRYCDDFVSFSKQLYFMPELSNPFQYSSQLEVLSEELAQLTPINVYSDTFIIGITQHGIGTINNLRLGRKPEEMVDWEEINAAWGQSVLLMHTLAKKLGLTFSKYKLIPMGASPFVQQKDQYPHGTPPPTFPLHGSPTVTFSRSAYFYEFWGSSSTPSNFDLGMEAFLFCVSELCARVVSLSSTVALPY